MKRRIERQAADLFAEVDGHAGRMTLPGGRRAGVTLPGDGRDCAGN